MQGENEKLSSPHFLILTLVSPVYADDFQDGMDAFDRKDYKTA